MNDKYSDNPEQSPFDSDLTYNQEKQTGSENLDGQDEKDDGNYSFTGDQKQ